MPGIEYEQLYRLMQLADRVSVNLEGPTQQRLDALAPKKDFQRELLSMLQLAEQIRRKHPYEKLASTVTQFVVGAVGDTDQELLSHGWSIHDLDFLFDGNLPTHIDPKRAWAERHLRQAPLEIMTAGRAQLLRVPGIGPVGVDKILHARRQGRITDLSHLRKLQIHAPEQAASYILLDGHKPLEQARLF